MSSWQKSRCRYFNMLNDAQKQAIGLIDGSVRIIAGAGTGKTRVLAHRIAHLIEKGVRPWRILALTFTNKAAHELKERLVMMGHPHVPTMTFHSLAARMLRKHWRADFKIVDDPKSLRGNRGVSPVTRNELSGRLFTGVQSDIELTFDELLTKFLEILPTMENPFEYVMVDEYQDVNEVQIEIVRRLSGLHHNVCVVGDPDQTIYGWRGSVTTSLRDFEIFFPNVRTITLTQNYRNPPAILKGAEALIKHNSDRLPKMLVAASQTPAMIQHWRPNDDTELFQMVIHLLEQKLGSHAHMHRADELDSGRAEGFYGFSDIAILYRAQEEGKKIAAALARQGYPYQMSAPESFWERSEIVKFLHEMKSLIHSHFDRSGEIPYSMPLSSQVDEQGISPCAPLSRNDCEGFSDWFRTRLNTFIENFKPSASQRTRLDHLLNYALGCDSLQSFLDEVALAQEADNLIEADHINLLTLHAAKGLEFPVVLVTGLEEGVLPHKKSDLEEERRLLYVGMTRATQELHLFSNAKKPSRFLAEIDYENLTATGLPEVTARQLKRRAIKKSQMKLFML